MTQVSITSVVREAILNHTVRNYQLEDIANKLNITKYLAKKLYFSFLWHPKEEVLQEIIETGELPNYSGENK